MKLSQRLQDERLFVERELANNVICQRCKATLREYADKCVADLSDACEGFIAIERCRAQFAATEKP